MKLTIQKLSSLPLMLLFTSAGFIVLAASVVLMIVESLTSSLLPQAASKTGAWRKNFTKAEVPSREPQVCSRT